MVHHKIIDAVLKVEGLKIALIHGIVLPHDFFGAVLESLAGKTNRNTVLIVGSLSVHQSYFSLHVFID